MSRAISLERRMSNGRQPEDTPAGMAARFSSPLDSGFGIEQHMELADHDQRADAGEHAVHDRR